jgi:ABC-2 type transport system permease protein
VIPPFFGRDLLAGRPAHVQTLVDGTLPYRAQVVKGYIVALNASVSEELARAWHAGAGAGEAEPPSRGLVTLEVRYLYNEAARSAWSFGPKLLMMILFMSAPFLTALGVVREKETGSIYNVFSSTVRRGEFLVGKLAPYAGIALINAVVLWLMATMLLGAPFKGNPLFLAGATFLYVLSSTGIGLLVSLIVDTQVSSMFATAVLTMIPAQLYSGALIPLESMSASGRAVARALPAVYYHEVVVGAFLKGVGLTVLWPEILVLAGYAVGLWTVSLLLFSKRPRA